jgi:hypothetical protein
MMNPIVKRDLTFLCILLTSIGVSFFFSVGPAHIFLTQILISVVLYFISCFISTQIFIAFAICLPFAVVVIFYILGTSVDPQWRMMEILAYVMSVIKLICIFYFSERLLDKVVNYMKSVCLNYYEEKEKVQSPYSPVSSKSSYLEINKSYLLKDITFFSIFGFAILFSILLYANKAPMNSFVGSFLINIIISPKSISLIGTKGIFSAIRELYGIFIGFPVMLFDFINPFGESFNPFAVIGLIAIIGICMRSSAQIVVVLVIAIPLIVIYLFFVLFFAMWAHNPNYLLLLGMIIIDISFIISITYFVVRIISLIIYATKQCFQNIMKPKLSKEVE